MHFIHFLKFYYWTINSLGDILITQRSVLNFQGDKLGMKKESDSQINNFDKEYNVSINNHKLLNLFHDYHHKIKKVHGIGSLLTKIGFLISLFSIFASDISFGVISNEYFKAGAIIGIIFGIYDLIKYIIRRVKNYDVFNLYNNIIDASSDDYHKEFIVIFVLKRKSDDNTTEFLVYKDKNWQCKMFPNMVYTSLDLHSQRKSLLKSISSQLGLAESKISLDILDDWDLKSLKYNKGMQCYTNYHFKFVHVNISGIENWNDNKKMFSLQSREYHWQSFNELLGEENNMKFNDDVIMFLWRREGDLTNYTYSFLD